MTDRPSMDHKLLDKLTEAIESNLQNEQFGVPELAEAAGLSKSQLNRRLQTITNQSASQFIREYRLKKAMELLQNKAATPTEVAYKVGFSSPSYFSTCFKEFYGYSPGEVLSRNVQKKTPKNGTSKRLLWIPAVVLIFIALSYVSYHLLTKGEGKPQSEKVQIDRSIAVLPFKNLSNKDEDLFLTDGVMRAIHQHLSRFRDLNLRSVTTTEVFKDTLMTTVALGKELEVAYLLEGSFQKVGDMALLLVKLIDARTDKPIWEKEFNEDWSDIFTVQKEVAVKIADELYATLTEDTEKGLDAVPTTNMEAYDLYLKASECPGEGLISEECEAYLHKAINLDPDFPLPYIGLGSLYRRKSRDLYGEEKAMMVRKAKWNLQKAIELDPYNGLAYSVLAVVNWQRERDSVTANRNFQIALKLAPNDWFTVRGYYYHQYYLGNCDQMRSIIKKMQEIEPRRGTAPASIYNIFQLECEDRYKELTAIGDHYHNEIVEKPHWTWSYIFKAYIYEKKYSKAKNLLDAMAEQDWDDESIKFQEAILQARQGTSKNAKKLIKELSGNPQPLSYKMARLYEALGDKEQMYAHLERALLQRETEVAFMSADFFEHQDEPRFKDIVARSWIPITY